MLYWYIMNFVPDNLLFQHEMTCRLNKFTPLSLAVPFSSNFSSRVNEFGKLMHKMMCRKLRKNLPFTENNGEKAEGESCDISRKNEISAEDASKYTV
jgi:hypothetical protein